MADTFNAARHGAIVTFPFAHSNATTTESNQDMEFVALSGVTLVAMPVGGSVVGFAASASTDLTAGSITLKAHKAGTEFAHASAPTAVINATNQQTYCSVRPGILTFDAGDTLGLSYTTTTTLDPTNSADIAGVLFVVFDPV